MSGGYFNYDQYKISDIIDTIERVLNKDLDEDEYGTFSLSENTINQFRNAIKYLKIAEIYVQRIDWLLSGDDLEEHFHKKLEEDIQKLFKE